MVLLFNSFAVVTELSVRVLLEEGNLFRFLQPLCVANATADSRLSVQRNCDTFGATKSHWCNQRTSTTRLSLLPEKFVSCATPPLRQTYVAVTSAVHKLFQMLIHTTTYTFHHSIGQRKRANFRQGRVIVDLSNADVLDSTPPNGTGGADSNGHLSTITPCRQTWLGQDCTVKERLTGPLLRFC